MLGAVMSLASLGLQRVPRPPCFMTVADGFIGFVVDERATPSRLFTFKYDDGGLPGVIVFASSATWAHLAAHNLASAYRPEGVA
jgi:hypothetical protein